MPDCQLRLHQICELIYYFVFFAAENDGHAAGADYRNSKSITCFNKCPNATVDDIVWCVNVFSLQWNVEVCLNQTWSNASSVAAIAEISQHFTVQEVSVCVCKYWRGMYV